MSSHSRKPKWAEGAERISWAHCRRPNCGAKPFVPSTVDPLLCQDCAEEYIEQGRRYYVLCDHWRLDDGRRYRRCPDCRKKARKAQARAAQLRYKAAHPERIAEKHQKDHARRQARLATDATLREQVRERARLRRYRNHARYRATERAKEAAYRERHRERVRALKRSPRAYYLRKLRKLQAVRGTR